MLLSLQRTFVRRNRSLQEPAARMVESVDTRDLKSLGHCGCVGSSPTPSTETMQLKHCKSITCSAFAFILHKQYTNISLKWSLFSQFSPYFTTYYFRQALTSCILRVRVMRSENCPFVCVMTPKNSPASFFSVSFFSENLV